MSEHISVNNDQNINSQDAVFRNKIFVINNVMDKLTKEQKIIIAKILWNDKILRTKIKEKGTGIEIRTKFIPNNIIDEMYNKIKELDFNDMNKIYI